MKKILRFNSLVLLVALLSFTPRKYSYENRSAEKVFNIRDYGAKGDGITDDAQAIQQAIDACSAAGGGLVLVPSGSTYLAGAFNLKSFIDFHVEAGAIVLANP